jgi:predicted acetyltransferase
VAEDLCPRVILDSEHDQCLEMLDRAFEWLPNGYFAHYLSGDPWYKNDYCRVYSVDGRIVSSVNICRREVRVGSSTLILGGIGNVGTDPDCRGKGYSSEVLRDCVKVMDEEEMDFSLLYTGIHGFYHRIGWRLLPIPFLSGKLKHTDVRTSDYTVRPYAENDAASLLRIYDAFSSPIIQTAIRTVEYWQTFCMHEHHPPWKILLAEDASGPVAYVISRIDKETLLTLDELGCLPGHEAALDVLVRTAVNDGIDANATDLKLDLISHPFVTAIAGAVVDKLEIQYWNYGMVMFFDLHRTFGRLIQELNGRAKAAGLKGSVQIETEMGSIALNSDGERVSIVGAADAKCYIAQPDLARLMLGMEPVKDPETDISGPAADFLFTLFPVLPSVYWPADMF